MDNTSSSPSPVPDGAEPQLTHIALDREFVGAWLRWITSLMLRIFAVVLAVGIVVGAVAAAVTNNRLGMMFGIFAAMLAMPVITLWNVFGGSEFRALRADLEQALRAGCTPRAACLLLMSHKPRPAYAGLARALTRAAAAAGPCNRVICVARPEGHPDVDPFRVPFEARSVDECIPGFDELQTAGETVSSAALEPEPPSLLYAPLRLPRWMSRNQATWGGRGGMITALAAMVLVVGLDFMQGSGWSHFYWFWIALIVVGFLVPVRKLRHWGQDWYVAPGAVIVRRNRPFHKAVDVQVYDRRTSVLLATAFARSSWQLTVASGDHVAQTTVSPPEAAFVLRAFLSPLTPPDIDEPGDFR